ncbi:hypothetical protein NDU88_003410 [Pleurodeles waltl]|uniref:Reverse transcriptase domain-containing protein n=1 Tax=Pleurodeles waltl TaxID=8319 RepID=A0AAV7NI12_PLEWA|nr:hypothetical protein NDU88_003410 [Pleurodeles waltl]
MYRDECERLLGNTRHYKRMSRDPTIDVQEEITFLVSKGKENNWITDHEASDLIQTNPKIPYFYILPKVHKEKIPPPGRPIVSRIGSALEPLSKFVDFFRQPLVKRIPTYLKDTTHVLLLLESITFDKSKELLITLDVESLYTNIPQEATLEVISNLLDIHMGESQTPPGFILDLAHLALTRNYFKFEDSFFLQTQGTSMGSIFAPSLACLYVDHIERHTILHEDNPYQDQIKLWKRYIDDVLLIWTGSKEEAQAFAVWLNGANPFLTFTMNIGDKKLPFLDLLIYEQDGGLATEVYYKPTDCNNLLQYQSFHPRALRDDLPVGQFLRLRRNCSSVTDYRKHADKLSTKLHTKDYPPHLVNRARKRARNNNRDQLLQPRAQKPSLDKIVCVTTFNTLSNEIQKIMREN